MNKLFFTLVLLLNLSCSNESNTITAMEKALIKAGRLDVNGDQDNINSKLNRIIELDRVAKISYNIESERLKRDSIFKVSINILDRILQNRPNPISLELRATFHSKLMNYESAIADFKQVIENDSTNFVAHYNLGKLYERMEEFQKSLESYSKAIELKKNNPTLYLNRGFILLKFEKYDLAISDFKRSLIEPENKVSESYSYNNLGFAYLKKGNFEEAYKNINKSIELYELNSYSYKNLALVYFAQNKNDQGCKLLNTADSLGYQFQYDQEVQELSNERCK